MDNIEFHGYWTLALLILFIAIVIWAWSSKRKKEFDELANLPLDEEKFANQVEGKTSGEKDDA
ncbi:MAG TPA: cbb3-type cytochrome c oxidase subunit 3 [Gammaproteobacteria bacterium]|nr:cbb3-type cytochrome c oxidase subunit 3 [Gammaproteobacteria bacterium]